MVYVDQNFKLIPSFIVLKKDELLFILIAVSKGRKSFRGFLKLGLKSMESFPYKLSGGKK